MQKVAKIISVWLGLLGLSFWFGSVTAAAATANDLAALVRTNSEQLVQRFEQEKNLYYKDPERFYRVMEEALESMVDFRRIAARIMGRHARAATKEQRDQFVEAFKRSLFNAYAKALVESGDFKVSVISASVHPRDDTRGSVDMEILTPSGSKYPITYSLYHNKEDGKWYVENVIVSGINIGLAFRDRFEQEMTSRRDLQQVISNWSSKIDENELQTETK